MGSIETTKYILALWEKEYEAPERFNFAIELKNEGTLIGGIDVIGYEDGVPVIGYCLGRAFWNRGYMTEACRCVTAFLFSRGYDRVRIDADAENIGSQRVILKCGGLPETTQDRFVESKQKTVRIRRFLLTAPKEQKAAPL